MVVGMNILRIFICGSPADCVFKYLLFNPRIQNWKSNICPLKGLIQLVSNWLFRFSRFWQKRCLFSLNVNAIFEMISKTVWRCLKIGNLTTDNSKSAAPDKTVKIVFSDMIWYMGFQAKKAKLGIYQKSLKTGNFLSARRLTIVFFGKCNQYYSTLSKLA